jgi:hypothetical protein
VSLHRLALFTLLLCSCTPRVAEILPLEAEVEEGLISGDGLVCPRMPSPGTDHPPPPYDEDVGDCALVERSAEIESWLTELEDQAEGCRTRLERNWLGVLSSRDSLDLQIDALAELPAEDQNLELLTEDCPSSPYTSHSEAPSPLDPDTLPSHHYTDWLGRIAHDVSTYCQMVDEIVAPLTHACTQINFYQACRHLSRRQYHSIVEAMMNEAERTYSDAELFYSATLQVSAWDDFRTQFASLSLVCPPSQLAANMQPPTVKLLNNAKCRRGASTAYDVVAFVEQGETATVVGRNDNWTWWLIRTPDQYTQCWVWSSLVAAITDTRDVPLVASPPLPTATSVHQQHGGTSEGCWVVTLQHPNGACLPRACTPNDFPGTPCTP